jgi:putative oxidoreductase
MNDPLEARVHPHTPIVLSLVRIFLGLLFFLHGTSTVFGWPVAPAVAQGSLSWFVGWIVIITGALIAIGFYTRAAAFVAAIVMAIEFIAQNLPQGLLPLTNGGELTILYFFAFLLLGFAGPGVYALETRAGRGRETYVRGHMRRTPRRWLRPTMARRRY